MWAGLFVYCFILVSIQSITSNPACIYPTTNGPKLDMRTLGFDKGKPKYAKIPSITPGDKNKLFSWNGCFSYSLSDRGNCTNAAACYTNTTTGLSTRIVTQEVAQFEYEEGVGILTYQTGNVHLVVILSCRDEDEDTVSANEEDVNQYKIIVQSRCCCPGKCHLPSLGTGAILVIVFIVVVFVYVVGGILFLRLHRHATGLDMIPNRSMWSNVGSNAVNGVRYSIQVIRNRSLNVQYQKI